MRASPASWVNLTHAVFQVPACVGQIEIRRPIIDSRDTESFRLAHILDYERMWHTWMQRGFLLEHKLRTWRSLVIRDPDCLRSCDPFFLEKNLSHI